MKVCNVLFFIWFFFTGVFAETGYEESIYKETVVFVNECGSRSLTLCMKEKALRFIERLPNNIDIGNGIRIKQSESERLSREYTPMSLPNETEGREAVLDRMLLHRIADYLTSHTLEFKFPMGSDLGRALSSDFSSVVEGRGKGGGGGEGGGGGGGGGGGKKGGKKGGMGGMMMMLFSMKAAMLYAIALKFVAMIAFKALLAAKVALTIAGIIALKKLVQSKHHTSTYEVVAHPVQSHHDDWGHHDRAFNQELVYKGYRVGS